VNGINRPGHFRVLQWL